MWVPSTPITKPIWTSAPSSLTLNLYNRNWPLRTSSYPDPPAKFTFDDTHRRGEAIDSIVSGGSILSGGVVRNSVLGRGVRVHTGALVEGCVIMDNCDIGRHAQVRRAILDKNVHVPEDAADRARSGGRPRARMARHRIRHRGCRRPTQRRARGGYRLLTVGFQDENIRDL